MDLKAGAVSMYSRTDRAPEYGLSETAASKYPVVADHCWILDESDQSTSPTKSSD
jgi:hypothetical protein